MHTTATSDAVMAPHGLRVPEAHCARMQAGDSSASAGASGGASGQAVLTGGGRGTGSSTVSNSASGDAGPGGALAQGQTDASGAASVRGGAGTHCGNSAPFSRFDIQCSRLEPHDSSMHAHAAAQRARAFAKTPSYPEAYTNGTPMCPSSMVQASRQTQFPNTRHLSVN